MGRWASPGQISAAMRGERDGADALIAAIWPKCFRLAATIIGDRALAQDAAQEACVIVVERSGAFVLSRHLTCGSIASSCARRYVSAGALHPTRAIRAIPALPPTRPSQLTCGVR